MLLNDVLQATDNYLNSKPKTERKKIGQFFTSKETALFMANLSKCQKENIKVLDAGAGSGILSIALLEQLNNNDKIKSIEIDLYENDEQIVKLLEDNMQKAKLKIEKLQNYNIIKENFITKNKDNYNKIYDIVISNPPYKKIGKNDIESTIMENVIYGQPNMYFLFMAMAERLLKDDGELIFIVPRSWTSGTYFKKFREVFLNNVKLTNIHLFVSRDKVFNKENVLIVNGEDKLLQNISSNVFKVKKIGYNHEYDVYASNIILREEETEFLAHAFGEEAVFNLPMAGKHNVLNTMLAIEVSECLGVSFKQMVKGLENLEATSMRLQVVKKQGLTIINDCYNASPDSMKSSLDVLSAYKNGRRVAILGDMYELGDESEKAHYEVGKYAKDKVDTLIVIGGYIKNFKDGFDSDNIIMYNTKEECIKELENIVKLDDVVLIKASRGVKLEDVVKKLEEM